MMTNNDKKLTKLCDLSDVCIGDTLVLVCGGKVTVTSTDEDMVYHHNSWWTKDAGSYCDSETCEFDVIAVEKKPIQQTPEEKGFNAGYEKGRREGQIMIMRRLMKQLDNEASQAERSFEAKYGKATNV